VTFAMSVETSNDGVLFPLFRWSRMKLRTVADWEDADGIKGGEVMII
jgi:hypothetical protein